MVKRRTRQVCCCGAESWTKVIAAVQIIGSATLSLMVFFNFFRVLKDMIRVNQLLGGGFNYDEAQVFAVGIILFLFCLLSLFMGVVLLMGVRKRNPNYLSNWLKFSVCALLLDTMVKLLWWSRDGSSNPIPGLMLVVAGFLWNCCLIWVVSAYKEEVEMDSDPHREQLAP